MEDYKILIATDPGYEWIIAEIWYKGSLIVEITQETEERQLHIYTSGKEPLIVDYKDFIKALTTAHDSLDKEWPLGRLAAECGYKHKNVDSAWEDFSDFFKGICQPGYDIMYYAISFHLQQAIINTKRIKYLIFELRRRHCLDALFLVCLLSISR